MTYKDKLICKQLHASPQTARTLASVAEIELLQHSAFDPHTEMSCGEAFLLGFYSGQEDRGGIGDASGTSALEMILRDLHTILCELIERDAANEPA